VLVVVVNKKEFVGKVDVCVRFEKGLLKLLLIFFGGSKREEEEV